MKNIYETLVSAIAAHWRAHNNRYPQQIVLSASQHSALIALREIERGGTPTMDPTHFLSVPIKVDDAAPSELVAVNGSRALLV